MIDQEQLSIDLQEAASIRYGVWLRLATLTSGHWAIYYGAEAGGGKETGVIEITETLDAERLRVLSALEQEQAAQAQSAAVQKAPANLEDMGL